MSNPQRIAPNAILRVVLYGPGGETVNVRPVDVAELVASGYSKTLPAAKPEPSPIPAPAPRTSEKGKA